MGVQIFLMKKEYVSCANKMPEAAKPDHFGSIMAPNGILVHF